MSLLTFCQDAVERCGVFATPSAIVGSSNDGAKLLFRLANQEGRELSRRHPWQRLIKEITFTSTAEAAEIAVADFRWIVPGTFWNRTTLHPVNGPLTPQEYQSHVANVSVYTTDHWRLRGDTLTILPTPDAGHLFAFEYISAYWAGGAADTAPTQDAFEQDTDITFLDEELLTLGLVWRLLRSKGLDYAEAFRTYEVEVTKMMGRDGGRRMIDATEGERVFKPRAPMPPGGNWPL